MSDFPLVPDSEYRRKYLLKTLEQYNADKGSFFLPEKIDIPGIIVRKDEENFIIKWYSLDYGAKPVRKGYNIDFADKNSPCKGKRLLCEKAFSLSDGKSGVIDYNYRFSGYHGQHYEQYRIYFVCSERLEYNTFTKAGYEYKYDKTVSLF